MEYELSARTGNRNKLLIFSGVAIGLVLLFALFFYFRDSTSENDSYHGKIIIGAETWPGYLPLYVAEDKGYFTEQGLDVDIKRYTALGELSKDYVAGKMQGRANIVFDALLESLDGMDHKIVLAIDYSSGADAIIARPNINSIKALRGRRVGYEPNTLEEFFLTWALSENGLAISDIMPVAGSPEQVVRLLKDGKIEAAVSHEPFIAEIIKSGQARPLYSSADAPGLITDILTFQSNFIDAYPDVVQKIVRAYFKALRFWQTNPDEANEILGKEFGVGKQDIAQQLQGVTMLDERANRSAFVFAPGLQSLYGNLRRTAAFIQSQPDHGMHGSVDSDRLIESRFVNDLVQ